VKNGQLFGKGSFDDGADSGIWRNRYLVFLNVEYQKSSKIYKVLENLSCDFLEAVKPKILSEMEIENLDFEGYEKNLDSESGYYTRSSLEFLENIEAKNLESVMTAFEQRVIDVNVADKNGITALFLAATCTFEPKIVNLLLNHGANVLQTMIHPRPFDVLRVCLNILHYKSINFEFLFDRIKSPEQVDFHDPYVATNPKLRPISSANSGSNISRRKRAKILEEQEAHEAMLAARQKIKVPETHRLSKLESKNLREIVRILIRRGATITKFCLAAVVISCDDELLEYVFEHGNVEKTSVYSDYEINNCCLSILHLAVLTERNSTEIVRSVLKNLPGLDINQKITSELPDTAKIPSPEPRKSKKVFRNSKVEASISPADLKNQSLQNQAKFETFNFENSNFDSSFGEEIQNPAPFYTGWRAVDLAIMKKKADRDLIRVLSTQSCAETRCIIRRGDRIITKLNHTQLAMVVHGTDQVSYSLQNMADVIKKPTINLVCDLLDIESAPIRQVGEAEARLSIVDHVLRENPGTVSLTDILPDPYSSKTIMDFAYHQFLTFAKNRMGGNNSAAAMDKNERAAMNENKFLLRTLAERYRNCRERPDFKMKFCYECCRSNIKSSSGSIETLKKYLKPTKLSEPPYFCSGYCKARIIENLKAKGLLVNPSKTKSVSSKFHESLIDDISSMGLTNNTPGISKLTTNRNSRNSTLNHGTYNRRNILNLKKGQSNPQTLLQQIDAYRQDKKFGVYKDISLLSLRNENFNLPFPEPASSARQLVGINESSENYSYN
jgi:hypothetical protein